MDTTLVGITPPPPPPPPVLWLEDGMKLALYRRSKKGRLRIYKTLVEKKHENDGSLEKKKNEKNEQHNVVEVTHSAGSQIDFSSNDYLGLARNVQQQEMVEQEYQLVLKQHQQQQPTPMLGSTGSRLLSGDSHYVKQLEQYLALLHQRPAALLFNSGYDANLSVLSCLPSVTSVVLFDEYSHNSLQMGLRWWLRRDGKEGGDNHNNDDYKSQQLQLQSSNRKQMISFQHNNMQDLQTKLEQLQSHQQHYNHIVIVVESVYSMDGDITPLDELLQIAQQFGALVIVDDAHGLGVLGQNGMGAISHFHVTNHPNLWCSIHTFGKAAGCHGAVVCGSLTLRQYLWNYAYPLIYSTSLPLHSLVTIKCSYQAMSSSQGKILRQDLQTLISYFRMLVEQEILHTIDNEKPLWLYLLPSTSPIQALVLPRNNKTNVDMPTITPKLLCQKIHEISKGSIYLYPIQYPTVPQGQERIRIVIHAHNTKHEIQQLVYYLKQSLQDLILPSARL